jgi:hypothetical protein
MLTLIKSGYLSDPPGIALYYQIGLDSKNGCLPIYRCMHGTNMTEGGVHKQIHCHVPVSGISPQYLYSCLLDFILRHNLLVRLLTFFLVILMMSEIFIAIRLAHLTVLDNITVAILISG